MEEKYTLAQWLNNELSEKELDSFKNNEDFLIYEKIKNYSSQLKTSDFNEEKMLSNIFKAKKEKPKVIPLYKKTVFKIAAILILFTSIGYFYTAQLPEVVVADNSNLKEFLLPDNSEIVMNTGASIEYRKKNWDSNRNLNLKGEAYFKVAKGKKFTVETNIGDVQVLGTQFNVNTENNVLSVVCFEGSVKVTHNHKQIILKPTQSIQFKNGKLLENKSIKHLKPSWVSNQLEYSKINLESLVQEIENNYNIKIKNNNLNSAQLFTGNIPSKNLKIALKIIASTYQIQFTEVSQNNYVIEK